MLDWLLMNFFRSSWGISMRRTMCPLSNNFLNAFKVVSTSAGFLLNLRYCWSRIHLPVDRLEFRKSSSSPFMGKVARIFFWL